MPESKKMLKKKKKHKENRKPQTEQPIEKQASYGHRSELKDLPTAKAGTICITKLKSTDNNPKYKMNVHESYRYKYTVK